MASFAFTHFLTAVGTIAKFASGSWNQHETALKDVFSASGAPESMHSGLALTTLAPNARKYATNEQVNADTPFTEFCRLMRAGPWADRETLFSILSRMVSGTVGNGNPQETVSQLEQSRAKVPSIKLPDWFMIFVLLWNLPASFEPR